MPRFEPLGGYTSEVEIIGFKLIVLIVGYEKNQAMYTNQSRNIRNDRGTNPLETKYRNQVKFLMDRVAKDADIWQAQLSSEKFFAQHNHCVCRPRRLES